MATKWERVGPRAFSVMMEALVVLAEELEDPVKKRFADMFEAGRVVYREVDPEDRNP